MYFEFQLLFSVGLYSLLNCVLSTSNVTSQSFQLSVAGHNQCPSPADAFQCLSVKCLVHCAFECYLSPCGIGFSYYASSGKCYLYSSLPSNVSYNNDCNFMMVSYTYFSIKLHKFAA